MAKRPVYTPQENGQFVKEEWVDFKWYPGFSLQQKQRSIDALHTAAKAKYDLVPILEISSKSPQPNGIKLSAFNLEYTDDALGTMSVEVAFQGSKIFENGGPYTDLYKQSSREAKRDSRLKESGVLKGFQLGEDQWPLEPKTAFYDWLYLKALMKQPDLAQSLLKFNGFTDIEFNPQRSINCQARSAALYVSLNRRGLLESALSSKGEFLEILSSEDDNLLQPSLPFN